MDLSTCPGNPKSASVNKKEAKDDIYISMLDGAERRVEITKL
jgi:hypothetical protein